MNYLKIEGSSLSNGVGWRVVLWVSGCDHGCYNCQNPESWNPSAGKPFTDKQKQKIVELLSHKYIKGLTLSGGDPMMPCNREAILDLVKTVKSTFVEKDIWLYTGYLYEEIENEEILNYVDVVVDGPYKEELRDISLPFKGSENQRIIDVKQTRKRKEIVILM
ncbi:MAG: anaerobic ribonucleoside-triphosphate reductase activating protein [Erysipelotrichaceae bacterium]